MTTFIDFTPSATSAFQTTITLDGEQYTLITNWNIYQRWYLNLYSLSGNLIVAEPLVASPDPLPLAPPLVTQAIQSMTWSPTNGGQVAVVMVGAVTFGLGATVVISGATNSGTAGDAAVNGAFVVDTWTDQTHFTFLLTATAGAIGTIGGSPVVVTPTAALSWSSDTGRGLVTGYTAAPHGLALGAVARLTIANETPSGYCGSFLCTVTGPSEFTYSLATDPGAEVTPGTYCEEVDLAGDYFTTSRLVYRESQTRFEVTP